MDIIEIVDNDENINQLKITSDWTKLCTTVENLENLNILHTCFEE